MKGKLSYEKKTLSAVRTLMHLTVYTNDKRNEMPHQRVYFLFGKDLFFKPRLKQ